MAATDNSEAYKWTLRADALACCFICDVHQMRQDKEQDMYWLNRWPCRSVEILGIVVGVQLSENKTTITLDDGTAVIDCIQAYSKLSKPDKKASLFVDTVLPPPAIGSLVRIVGRVKNLYETRRILTDHEDACPSPTAEPQHWLKALSLHEQRYSKPFVIPVLPPTEMAKTPQKQCDFPPPTIAGLVSTNSSRFASPPVCATSPPVKIEVTMDQPSKLPNPLLLRRSNLTENTFRIYVKYFIDSANSERIPDDTPHSLRDRRRGDSSSHHGTLGGFTLNYLRRVPELRLLARKVVKAELRRLEKEKRREARQSQKQGTPAAKLTPSSRTGPKVKRLFAYAIRQLHEEGSIIISDGPARIWQNHSSYSWLWWEKSADTSSMSLGSSTLTSVLEETASESDEVSDATSKEESYVPVTSSLLRPVLLDAITSVIAKGSRSALTTKPGNEASMSRKPRRDGVTLKEIINWLHSDERWCKLGEWYVTAILNELEAQEVVWRVGVGLWAVM